MTFSMGLRSLGLTTATMPQVTAAVKELFPGGVKMATVVKSFGRCSSSSSVRIRADNVGR